MKKTYKFLLAVAFSVCTLSFNGDIAYAKKETYKEG